MKIKFAAFVAAGALALPAGAYAAGTTLPLLPTVGDNGPGSPAYIQRDNQNIADAYGRQTAPDGQFNNPAYTAELVPDSTEMGLRQLAEQAASANRLAITPGEFFPGWNEGNPFRRGWSGSRGIQVPISYTNRYGALIRGDMFAPLPGARDPYTHRKLRPPYPGVVITTGSVQGSERMYFWLAEDLAERGYVVMTYDVQGQGRSETLPHQGPVDAVPFCNPFATPAQDEQSGCPGVPFQQPSNFVFGTEDALDFFTSTPHKHYKNPHGSDQAHLNRFNPFWKLFDRRRDRHPFTRGRRTKIAIIGHSLGAFAVSEVQGLDRRVETAVALDKLAGPGASFVGSNPAKPKVPALGIQSEYGFSVNPYWMSGGSSLQPQPQSPSQAPNPKREELTGFDAWRKSRHDTMVIVPRASTHLEYTDISYALPASRYGQDLSSYYVQAWLNRYLKHRSAKPLFAPAMKYLEPVGGGKWKPVTLRRANRLSFYYCSGWSIGKRVNLDIARVGGCTN